MSTSASSSGWLVDEQGQWYMQHGHWIARVDPASQSVYYQDLRSHKTQWETPGDWSIPCAPSRKPKKLPARCLDFSHRAARCQVDPDTVKKTSSTPEGAGEFNIWYGRWVGELWNEHHNGMISFPVAFATPVDIYNGERTRACVYVCVRSCAYVWVWVYCGFDPHPVRSHTSFFSSISGWLPTVVYVFRVCVMGKKAIVRGQK